MARKIHRRRAIATAIAGGAMVAPTVSQRVWAGDSFQTRTGRIVVPFAAGGTADCLGRLVAQILAKSTSSAFVVENRTGAGGNVSAEIVAKAMPDGRTLLLGTVGTAVTNQYLYKYIPYDSEWSFTPIALLGEVANVVVVHPSFPASTLGEFVDICKNQASKKISYGSPAIGGAGHLSMKYLQDRTSIKLKHVAYVSRSRMIKDLLAGHILMVMDNLPPFLRHIESGALRALGVTSVRRWFAAPEVPSIAEQGYPGFDATLWWYIAAPGGMRLELAKKFSNEIVKGIRSEPAIKRIRESGALELPGDNEDLARHIVSERIKWKRVIDAAKLEPQ